MCCEPVWQMKGRNSNGTTECDLELSITRMAALFHVVSVRILTCCFVSAWRVLVQDVLDLDELKNMKGADGIDPERKEEYLSEEQFEEAFGTGKDAFAAMPKWKRIQKKKDVGLF